MTRTTRDRAHPAPSGAAAGVLAHRLGHPGLPCRRVRRLRTLRAAVMTATTKSRRSTAPEPKMSQHPNPHWPPTCVRVPPCQFVGEPSAQASPYIACGGDPARHQRTPVGAS